MTILTPGVIFNLVCSLWFIGGSMTAADLFSTVFLFYNQIYCVPGIPPALATHCWTLIHPRIFDASGFWSLLLFFIVVCRMRSLGEESRLWAWTGGWRLLLLLGLAQRQNSMWEKFHKVIQLVVWTLQWVSARCHAAAQNCVKGAVAREQRRGSGFFVVHSFQGKSSFDTERGFNLHPSPTPKTNKQIINTFEWLSEGAPAYPNYVWRTTACETTRSHTQRIHSWRFWVRLEDLATKISSATSELWAILIIAL